MKNRTNRLLGLVLLIGSTLVLTACPRETTIGRLSADPARFRDRDVALRGVVVNSFGALGMGAYELDDETGRIWVLTEMGVPPKGSRIRPVGRFINGVTWGGRNFGNALRETDRRR
jgi:hypothetical protein